MYTHSKYLFANAYIINLFEAYLCDIVALYCIVGSY